MQGSAPAMAPPWLHRGAVAVALLAVSAAATRVDVAVQSSLSFDVAAAKSRPVSKVIALLKDMKTELEKEGETDEEVYDTMACWCETNDKIKTKEIADGEAKIAGLTTKIEELKALSARLQSEISSLEKELDGNQKAVDKAQAIRGNELGEFNGEEKDLLQSISALKAAITVLSKHHSASLLQVEQTKVFGIAATLQYQMRKHGDLLKHVLTQRQQRAVALFLQQPMDYFDAKPTFKQSYAPQSSEILGILKQMKETFESNLSQSQKEEMAAQKAYEDTKAGKEAQIKAGMEQIDKKTQELAVTDEKKVNAKQDLEDTEALKAANEDYLAILKEKCAEMDSEWEARQKTRTLELAAVSKALAILSSDDAHDLFTKTFNPALVQRESVKHRGLRNQAAAVVQVVAAKTASPELAALVLQIKLDAFTKVKQAIDDMMAQLLQEKTDEIKHKDFCVDEFNTNQLQTEEKEREKSTLEAKIADPAMTIKTLTEEIEKLKAQVAEMQVQMKRAGEDREKENKDFQLTVADQRASIKLLKAAIEVLKGFYDKKALLQASHAKQEPVGPPPPAGFKKYVKNKSAPGVMGMIQQIIDDAQAVEAEAIRAEADAQKMYEDFVKETNAAIDVASKAIVNKSEEKAQAEMDETNAEKDLDSVETALEQLASYKEQLHLSCDFVLKNFEIRQTARDEEIEALRQAKQILSGADFQAFLEG